MKMKNRENVIDGMKKKGGVKCRRLDAKRWRHVIEVGKNILSKYARGLSR